MKRAEPRYCVTCGVNRRAERDRVHCYECMPGGPFTPPPCRRCGTTDNFFASGLCARCHLHGTIRVDACPDCHAWGTTRRGGWLCRACQYWRRTHPDVASCVACGQLVAVNASGFCRLCWKSASGARHPRGGFDPLGGNRHGQQLFFADMRKAAKVALATTPPAAVERWPPGRPVTHRQLAMFTVARDVSRGRGPLPEPRDAALAAALDTIAVDYGRSHGWGRSRTSRVRSGIRILLGTQDTPGARLRHSDMADLPRLHIIVRPIIEVLDTVDMFDDDRSPAISRWFTAQTSGLPADMANELDAWFEVMHHGSTTPPRRKPRNPTTIKIYAGAALPAMRHRAATGHESLREVTRADVLAALPREPARRKITGQAMRSIFTTLKDRKLIFVNPAVRLAHTTESPAPTPATDLDAVRTALNSPEPARAAICALVAFHGLRSHELRTLQLTDLQDRHLHLDRRVIPLAEPVRQRISTWLDHRAARWPNSTNPHLFIHFRTARRNDEVGARWVFLTLGLPGGTQALRADRILHEAAATRGDARRLSDLFGLSIQHATRYTALIHEPSDTPDAPH